MRADYGQKSGRVPVASVRSQLPRCAPSSMLLINSGQPQLSAMAPESKKATTMKAGHHQRSEMRFADMAPSVTHRHIDRSHPIGSGR